MRKKKIYIYIYYMFEGRREKVAWFLIRVWTLGRGRVVLTLVNVNQFFGVEDGTRCGLPTLGSVRTSRVCCVDVVLGGVI